MQQGVSVAGGAIPPYAGKPVLEADLEVYVNGVYREVTGGSWGLDTSGGLPDGLVNAGSGILSRTGSITFAPSETVAATAAHPVRRASGLFPPREGDSVVIDAVVDGVRYRRFTGRLGAVSSPFYGSGAVTAEITDSLGDHLQQVVSIEPQLGLGGNYLRSSWVPYTALEYVGLGDLPPATGGRVVLHSHFQNGQLPLVGRQTASGTASGDSYGLTAVSNNAFSVDNGVPRDGGYVCVFGRASSDWDSDVSVRFSNGHSVKLKHFKGSHELELSTSAGGTLWTGRWEGTQTLPYLAMLIADRDIRVWVSESSKSSVLVPVTSFPTHVRPVSATGTFLIGVDVRFCRSVPEFQAAIDQVPELPVSWVASSLEQDRIPATRGYENVTARQVVQDWSEATLGVLYMDEWGKPIATARDRLIAGKPQQTLTVGERVFEGRWEIGRDGKRRGVIVKGLQANVRGGRYDAASTVVYQPANKQELEFNQEDVQFISIPEDEDWHGVDVDWKPVVDIPRKIDNTKVFNNSRVGSYWSVSFQYESSAEDLGWPSTESLKATLEKLGQRTYKTTHLVSGNQTNNDNPKYFQSTTTLKGSRLYSANRGINMPLIRARALVQWVDYGVRGVNSVNDMSLRDFILEAGWWLSPGDAQRYANALSSELLTDRYTFDGVEVLYDPRRQVGDTETWKCRGDDGKVLWEASVLVTGYSENWEGGVPTQRVDVQVKNLTDPVS